MGGLAPLVVGLLVAVAAVLSGVKALGAEELAVQGGGVGGEERGVFAEGVVVSSGHGIVKWGGGAGNAGSGGIRWCGWRGWRGFGGRCRFCGGADCPDDGERWKADESGQEAEAREGAGKGLDPHQDFEHRLLISAGHGWDRAANKREAPAEH